MIKNYFFAVFAGLFFFSCGDDFTDGFTFSPDVPEHIPDGTFYYYNHNYPNHQGHIGGYRV